MGSNPTTPTTSLPDRPARGKPPIHPLRCESVQVVAVHRCGLALLFGLMAFGSACASKPKPVEAVPPLRVRVGAIAPDAYDAVANAPAPSVERIERLVDLFFRVGCAGDQLTQPRPAAPSHHPDVVCRLPGRSPQTIVVAAYLDPSERSNEDWSGAALLPQLYRALSVQAREHTYVFVGFSESSRRGVRGVAMRIEEVDDDHLRALVDLQHLRANASKDLLFSSSDASLRVDLGAVGAAVGMPREMLRYVDVPDAYQRDDVPTISIASPLQQQPDPDAPPDPAQPRVDEREAYQATGRTIAVFLAYLDDTLRIRNEDAPAVGAAVQPAPPTPPEPL